MGKHRSKRDSPHLKSDLRREKIDRLRGGKPKGRLPSGFSLPPQSKKKQNQLEKYRGHVARREAQELAEAQLGAAPGDAMLVEKK